MTWAPKFLWSLPSWVVEAISGIVTVGLVLLAVWLAQWWWGLLIVATALSLIYEKYIDGSFSWDDVLQREVAMVFAVSLWAWLR